MTPKIKYWQWPNVLSIDAALIAVAWQAALANALQASLAFYAYLVLGLSVWLTYLADRLLDVTARDATALLSARHQFTKRHTRPLWWVWSIVLAINLLLATQLTITQLDHGVELLLACLLYTLLNQKLSRRFFPKEICVALIYAGGVVIFLKAHTPLNFVAFFSLLCLSNCLIIGAKEKAIDAMMQVHSMVPLIAERWLPLLALAGGAGALWVRGPLHAELALSFGLLGLLHLARKLIPIEVFRVMADGVLLLSIVLSFLV